VHFQQDVFFVLEELQGALVLVEERVDDGQALEEEPLISFICQRVSDCGEASLAEELLLLLWAPDELVFGGAEADKFGINRLFDFHLNY